jgi:hypothetical protein
MKIKAVEGFKCKRVEGVEDVWGGVVDIHIAK